MPDRTISQPPPGFDEAGDATRRTWLASERTWLAWVRTGLASSAVALGVGRVVPEVAHASHRWPYALLGAGYGILGAALVIYGFQRRREVDQAVRAGRYVAPDELTIGAFAVLAGVLGVGTAVVAATV
jgi:putative membrane protein